LLLTALLLRRRRKRSGAEGTRRERTRDEWLEGQPMRAAGKVDEGPRTVDTPGRIRRPRQSLSRGADLPAWAHAKRATQKQGAVDPKRCRQKVQSLLIWVQNCLLGPRPGPARSDPVETQIWVRRFGPRTRGRSGCGVETVCQRRLSIIDELMCSAVNNAPQAEQQ